MIRRIRFAFAPVLAALLAAPPALAHPVGADAPYVVRVEDEDGRPLRTFHHAGKTFVLGAWGDRYVIHVENHTGRRVETVVSVDGRDVVSGRVGDYVSERGYLIGAWDEVVIEGFRKSYDEVAAFRFSDPEESYSSRMGTPENVGIIGVAFFPEAEPRLVRRWPARPRPTRLARERYDEDARAKGRSGPASAAPSRSGSSGYGLGSSLDGLEDAPAEGKSADSSAAARGGAYAEEEAPEASVQNLGTEYGESVDSHVTEVPFRRASPRHPSEVVTLRYDDRDGLLARGIRLERPRPIAERGPEAFPGRRFAPPPP